LLIRFRNNLSQLPLNLACGEAGRVFTFENKIMTLLATHRGPAWMRLSLVSALSVSAVTPLFAQGTEDKTLTPVVVTGSRFASDSSAGPIGATIISAGQIRASGIGNVNEAIRKIGGVRARQSTNGTQDHSLDLRGFGPASSQNMVVLVDGIRLSENELAPALLSSIPIELVDRIEIIRGGSSVLYGDGATGGIIHVITKRAALNSQRGTVVAETGSNGHKELRASVSRGWETFALDANVSTQRADNFRDNNKVRQDNFSGGVQWASREGRAGARIDLSRQDSRLPGALTLAQFHANPRQTTTPNDFGSIDVDRYTLFAERRIGALDIAAELSHREKTVRSRLGTFSLRYDGRVTQFSPRIRHVSGSAGFNNELVIGTDLTRWTRLTNNAFSRADESQKTTAFYVRDELRFGNARVAAGARTEAFDKVSVDPAPFSSSNYTNSQRLNAWELQGSQAITPGIDLFAKAGRSYRIPNVDENGFTPVAGRPLKPQFSRDLELGTSIGNAERKMTARVFQHRLKDEIFFDPTANFGFGANVNLDPTKREGIEIETSARLAPAFTLRTTLQHVRAKFISGPNAGKEMVLVPRNSATIRLNWLPGNNQSADVGLQWVGEQRHGADFANTCTQRVPSHATLDARYALRSGPWEFAISGANLTDKNYYSNAFGVSCSGGIYPDAGRQLKITARMDF
jgi:iron complex outermembrane receptor protein